MHLKTLIIILSLAASSLAETPSQSIGGIPNVKDSATITGVVLFKGTKPKIAPITDIAGIPYCAEHHKDKLPMKDTFVFGKNGENDTLVNVLVYVSKGLENKEFPTTKTPVVLDQVGCMYVPHVVAVMAGQTLQVRNSDSTLHNVMSTPRENDPFNFGMPVQGSTYDLVLNTPEMKINTKCFMHPWMSGYIHVLPNPFFAVTGADGTFTIQGLPPGKYELSVLHESSLMKPETAKISMDVAAGDKKKIEFVYHNASETK